MPTIDEIRHANLLLLLDALAGKHGERGAVQRLADAMGRSHSQISQLKSKNVHSRTGKPRNIGPSTARLMETAAGKGRGWMDVAHDDEGLDAKLTRLVAAEIDRRAMPPTPPTAPQASHPFRARTGKEGLQKIKAKPAAKPKTGSRG